MTTHQLAGLLDHLRDGFGPGLKSDTAKAFAEASEAFRELPDQPLKALVKELKTKPTAAGGKKGRGPADVPALVARIRNVQSGGEPADPVVAEVESLTATQMKDVLSALGQKGTKNRGEHLERLRTLVRAGANGSEPTPTAVPQPIADPELVEQGVQLFLHLRNTRGLSILEVRSQFEPLRHYPKPVVEAISRRIGYTPDGSREEVVNRMLSNLEGIKMNQLRGEMILSGV